MSVTSTVFLNEKFERGNMMLQIACETETAINGRS